MARAGKPRWYPRLNWSDLKPATRKRHLRNGIDAKSYYTKKGQAKVRASRGHAKTPERPEHAMRNPEKYPEYVDNIKRQAQAEQRAGFTGQTLKQKALARKRYHFAKRRLWHGRGKRANDDLSNASDEAMMKFVAMDEVEADDVTAKVGYAVDIAKVSTVEIDGKTYDVVDWQWLLYH